MSGTGVAGLRPEALRGLRRGLLKAVAVPGRALPLPVRFLPVPPGWGAGALQVTAACLVPGDLVKVIDQGCDDAPGAVAIRRLFQRSAGAVTTTATADASLIQTRHRLPETSLGAGQVLVCQTPDIDRAPRVQVDGRSPLAPGPLPPGDLARLSMSPALAFFATDCAGRVAALPPWTRVEPPPGAGLPDPGTCALCGATDTHLIPRPGSADRVCSDTDWCAVRWQG